MSHCPQVSCCKDTRQRNQLSLCSPLTATQLMVSIRRTIQILAPLQMCRTIINCDQLHQNKLLQHKMTPPTRLQNNRTDTAAVPCVLKHEARSNGRRISKQTGPGCRDRCSRSESGLNCNRSKALLHTAADTTTDRTRSIPQETGCWRAAATQISTRFISMMRPRVEFVMKDWQENKNRFEFASTCRRLTQPLSKYSSETETFLR